LAAYTLAAAFEVRADAREPIRSDDEFYGNAAAPVLVYLMALLFACVGIAAVILSVVGLCRATRTRLSMALHVAAGISGLVAMGLSIAAMVVVD
jgi:hypothetical protein